MHEIVKRLGEPGRRSPQAIGSIQADSFDYPRARLAAVVIVLLLSTSPAAAEHLTLDPGARSIAPRPFDADVSVRMEDGGFHLGGRLLGFGQSLGVWLRGRLRDGGVTLDGQLHGDRTYNFRLDADGARPSITIEVYPGTL